MDAHRPCPDSALLAAFLDGALAGYERSAVVAHLAECPQCRAVALSVIEFQEVQALDDMWQGGQVPATRPPLADTRTLRWSRAKTRAPALIAVGAAALTLVSIPIAFLTSPWSAQQAVETLIDAAAAHRPIEARLSRVNTYAPPPSLRSRDVSAPGANPRLIATATDLRSVYQDDDAAVSKRALGVAALLAGELDEAIATLEIAASAFPDDVSLANDLAAAYYERAQRASRPDDLPAALSAVERVLEIHPTSLPALFNRALIITALGLRAEAKTAWQDYIARDPDSGWTAEASRRLAASNPTRSHPDWLSIRSALESAPRSGDAEAAVRYHASATRDFIENELLRRWVLAAKTKDDAAEDLVISRIRLIGEAFMHHAGDAQYADFVESVEQASAAGSLTQHAAVLAHEEFLAGLRLMAGTRFTEAAVVLRRAAGKLKAVKSPFEGRAQIELIATQYYGLQYEVAAKMLPSVRVAAERNAYASLVTRAAWLQGLAAFALNDFASAQSGYEEMLTYSAASRDGDMWVMANVLLANLHDMLGDGTQAWRYRVSASGELENVISASTRAVLLGSASGDAQAGEHHAAALLFQSILCASPGVPPNLEVQARAQRARSLHHLGRETEAISELRLARERLRLIADSQALLRVEADLLAAEAEVLTHRDRGAAVEAATRALDLPLIKRDHLRRARLHLQLANALLLDGHLSRAETAVTKGFAALEAFRSEPSAEFAIRASDPVWELYGSAAQIALRRGDLSRAFAYTERARMRTPQERKVWETRLVSLDDVQRALGPDTALAVLTQLDEHLHVWIIRSDDVATHSLPLGLSRGSALVASQLQEMVRGVLRPPVSADLFDSLLRPVSRLFGGAAQIVVVADAPYNRIAYAGLRDRRRNRFLVEDHKIVLAPNATAFARAMEKSHPTERWPGLRHAAVVGTSDDQGSHRTASLATSLGALYGASRVTRNPAATASHLVKDITAGDVVHVAARVIANDQFPSLSHLRMADDPGQKYSGSVFARNLADFQPRAQLVALEHGTGGTATPRADGAFGFARALIAAGISNVVSPVANVKAESLEGIWLDFHRHYAAGTAAAESLRRAQLAALGRSNGRLGPWATLTVFGSTQ